jgi:dTDP-4-amino-4,6-dideoxygalactose transaminase
MAPAIKFHIPYLNGNEKEYVIKAIDSTHISGDGQFTKKCQAFFNENFGFKKVFLTTSCTDALEMAALLLGIQPGDEVIMPSYTFVSTANAFLLRGAKIVFVDSLGTDPNMNAEQIEVLITERTKAIVVLHYGGIICDMDKISSIAERHKLFLVEDAALALGSSYRLKKAGSFGHLATFSFHSTKNVSCGEGGMLVVNDERFVNRAEVIREKGTNRNAFFRGEVDKYGWTDIGSSFLPSDILAAVLYAQLENLNFITQKRREIWEYYFSELLRLQNQSRIILPSLTKDHIINGSTFFFLCGSLDERTQLIKALQRKSIQTTFHYQALHKSQFYAQMESLSLPNSEQFSDRLVRLPIYPGLSSHDLERVVSGIHEFFNKIF